MELYVFKLLNQISNRVEKKSEKKTHRCSNNILWTHTTKFEIHCACQTQE